MRWNGTVAVMVLAFAVTTPAAGADPHRLSVRTSADHAGMSYGRAANRLADRLSPALPTAMMLASQAVSDADGWWGKQGRTLPPAEISITDGQGPTSAYANFDSGKLSFERSYLDRLNRTLAPGGSRRGKMTALAQLWALSAHERGHNLNYLDATDNGIMNPNLPAIPGRGYEWAASVLRKSRR